MSDRVIRFPDRTWDELEGLPQPLRNAAHRAIFHLLEEPVPTLADPFPEVDPLPGSAAGSRSGSGMIGCSPDIGRWLMKPMLTYPSDSQPA